MKFKKSDKVRIVEVTDSTGVGSFLGKEGFVKKIKRYESVAGFTRDTMYIVQFPDGTADGFLGEELEIIKD